MATRKGRAYNALDPAGAITLSQDGVVIAQNGKLFRYTLAQLVTLIGTGTPGWSPVLAAVPDGDRSVFEVIDWQGGSGTKPATGLYVSNTGLTATIGLAQDVRGLIGPDGPAGPQGIQGVQGTQGIQGATGPQGAQGNAGPQGSLGPQGPQGVQGPTGPQGSGLIPNAFGNLTDTLVGSVEAAGVNYVFVVNPNGDDRANLAVPAGLPGDQSLKIIGYSPGNGWTSYGQFTGVQGPAGPQGAQGATGSTGPQGAAGPAGTNGNTWISNAGAPSSGTGANGDFYLNSTNGDYYKKAAGSWTLQGNLKGATGATGAQGPSGTNGVGTHWLSGSGVPSDSNGVDSDMYLNTANGDVYQKVGTAWGTAISNIKGPQGTAGSTGAQGPTGATGASTTWREGTGAPSNATGVDGDLYLNGANGDVYQRASGTYSVIANIKGANGTNGSNGTNGALWRTGSGAPSNATGVDGDLYLNTATGDVYQRTSGTYSIVANITGPAGSSSPDRTINTQTGTTYTFVLTDDGKIVELNNAGAVTATIPPHSSVAFPVGAQIDLTQIGAGQVTIAAGAGVTIRSSGAKLKIAGQYSLAMIYQRATDEWVFGGDISA